MARKWLYIALGISLTLNILIVGFIIGRASGFKPQGRKPHVEFSARHVAAALPADARSKMGQLMRDRKDELRQILRERRQLQAAVKQLLAAEQVDQPALEAAFERYAELGLELARAPAEVLLQILPDLSIADRRLLSSKLFEHRSRMNKHLRKRFKQRQEAQKKGEA